MATAGDPILSPADLSARWGGRVKVKTLGNWRSLGEGPPYQKFGHKVGYLLSDVLAYEARNRFTTTKDYGKKVA